MGRNLSSNSSWLLAVGGWLLVVLPTTAGAHRLDEYLQATRVAIERERVDVDIDLTAGVSIAGQVTTWIDVNGDGEISQAESFAYARQVLSSFVLSVDGATTPLDVAETVAPTINDIATGVGILRVRASAAIPARAAGRHQLSVINTHHPESSVYLANALLPADTAIQILGQHRSQDQRSLTIDYHVGMSRAWGRIAWILIGFSALGAILWRRLDRFTTVETQPI